MTNLDNCPDCGGDVRLDQNNRLVCDYTVDEIPFSCGWTSPPLLELAPSIKEGI